MMEINPLQRNIMLYVKEWVNTEKTPVPQSKIIKGMEKKGVKVYTTRNAIYSLINKGFIRKAYSRSSNQTFYVMIRNVT